MPVMTYAYLKTVKESSMNKYSIGLFLLLSLMFYQCKGEGDVLATYSGGKITRGELYSWLDSRRIPRDSVMKKKANQKLKLRQIATDRLAYAEAIKAGFDKTGDMTELLSIVRENFLAGFHMKKIRNSTDFREKSARVRIIRLTERNFKMENEKRVNLTAGELEAESRKQMETARGIIARLNKNEAFEKLVQEFSDDPSKKEGGDIGYISEGIREPQIVNTALSLNPGEYSKEPVRVNNSIYVIKVEDRKDLTPGNIDSVIGDKTKAERMKKRLQFNQGRSLEGGLMNAADVSDLTDKAPYRNRNDVLFRIGKDEFTLGNLDRLIGLTVGRGADPGQAREKFDVPRKKQYAKRILSQRLMLREALKAGTDRDAEFLKEWNIIRENTLSNEYRNSLAATGPKISDREVREEYDKNKDRAYKKKVKRGGKDVEEVMPFGEVKERIAGMLSSRGKAMNRRKWEEDLLNKSEFKIMESKLQGD